MAKIKISDIRKMTNEEREKKLTELKMEMIKARVSAAKTGSSNIIQIKKIIAKILTVKKDYPQGGKK